MSDPAESTDDLLGRTFGARFVIDEALKRGGMGAVYRARDLTENDTVALKVVKENLADDPQALARFRRETRLLTELSHDHIVRAVAAGEEGGVMWIAMELVTGQSLRERLDARGRWRWEPALLVVRQVTMALAAAHEKGIVHRDLKPENIMLVDEEHGPRIKLLDFGIAKQAHTSPDGHTHQTGTGMLMGTPGYVAPEVVLEGTSDDPRSDFYALGVTWFELLTGRAPFTAKTPMALAMRHAQEAPPTLSSLLPYDPVPAPVERLVGRLLAKRPEDRPANAAELLALLDQIRAEAAHANTPVAGLPADAATEASTDPFGATGVVPFPTPDLLARITPSAPATSITPQRPLALTPPRAAPTPVGLRAAGAGVVLLVVVLGGGLLLRDRPTPPTPEQPDVQVSAPLTVSRTAVEPVERAPPLETPAPQKTAPPPRLPPQQQQALSRDLDPAQRGRLIVRPRPVEMEWRVLLPGWNTPLETPRTFDLAPGTYELHFVSRMREGVIRKTVVVPPKGSVRFEEDLLP
jgi:serine/threonine protein kinase